MPFSGAQRCAAAAVMNSFATAVRIGEACIASRKPATTSLGVCPACGGLGSK